MATIAEKILGGAIASLCAITVGCAAERDIDGYESDDIETMSGDLEELNQNDANAPTTDWGWNTSNGLPVTGGRLTGSVGDVSVSSQGYTDGYADSEYASVYTHVDEAENGAVMTIVDLVGGIDHADFAVGTRHVYNIDDYYYLEEGASQVSVVGCSGPTAGEWAFDQMADTVVVEVSDGPTPDTVTFEYSARFVDYGETSVITGSFDVAR